MAAKLIRCKTCGAEMASGAKACPQCGAKILEMSDNDRIIVRGKITGVGEVLGYSLNIDSIE